MDDYHYLGAELDVFARAQNWKRYLAAQMASFVFAVSYTHLTLPTKRIV